MKTLLLTPILLLATYTCFSVPLAKAAEPTTSATSAATPGTPAEVLHVYLQAIKEQDVATFKKCLSTVSLELREPELADGKKAQEFMKGMAADVGSALTQKGDEKIKDDTATISVKLPEKEGASIVVTFVKEDGNWKVMEGNEGLPPVIGATPAATWLAYLEAIARTDMDIFEKTIAPTTFEKMKQHWSTAKKGSKPPLQELNLKKGEKFMETFPLRNEKISADGQTATLDVNDLTRDDRWVRLHFVKGDDGTWKLTFTEDQMGELVPGELIPQG